MFQEDVGGIGERDLPDAQVRDTIPRDMMIFV